MNKLKFICIGAPKCGTTTLHYHLKQIEKLSLPFNKESGFFWNKKLCSVDYESLHDLSKEIFCEIDPMIMYFENSIENIKKLCDKSLKFLVILRNPVDRAISHYFMMKHRGVEKRSIEEVFLYEKTNKNIFKYNHTGMDFSYIELGYYAKYLKKFIKAFGRESFYFILFEDFIKDPEGEINSFLKFTKLDIQCIKIKEKLHKNKHKKPLFGLINKYLIYPNCSKYIIKKFISEEKRFLIKNYLLQLNSIDAKKYQYDEIKKTIFRKYYKKTIDDVKYIVDRELNAWKY